MKTVMRSEDMQAMQREMQNAMQPYFALMARISFLAPMSFVVEVDGGKIIPDPIPEPFAGFIERLRDMAMLAARHVATQYHFDMDEVTI